MSTILIISPEPWSAHSVSKHHYARELARRGHSVVFLDPPADGARGNDITQVDLSGEGISGALHVVRSARVAPGLRFWPAILRRQLEARWLARLEREIGARIDVVWLFENSRFYDMRFAGDRLKIYHQVDLNQNFHPQIAAHTADAVFCTSRGIARRLEVSGKPVTIITHGVWTHPFDPEDEAALFSEPGIHCVYCGNMSMAYLDRETILECVSSHGEVWFHFFGGFKDGDPFRDQLARRANVILHGKVDPDRLLAILANADLQMLCYQKAHFEDQSNPHKMMEYLLSGSPIVASYTSAYAEISELFVMSGPGGDFREAFDYALKNLEKYDSPALREARIAFAMNNTYQRQVDRIADALGAHGRAIRDGGVT